MNDAEFSDNAHIDCRRTLPSSDGVLETMHERLYSNLTRHEHSDEGPHSFALARSCEKLQPSWSKFVEALQGVKEELNST